MSSKPILRDLEVTFGQIPYPVYENLKYISLNEGDNHFTCRPCQKRIRIVYDNEISMTKNFLQHFESREHKYYSTPSSRTWDNLENTFNGSVPQVVKNNFDVFDMDANNFYCEICKKTIQISVNTSSTTKNFLYHLFSYDHEDNLDEYRELLAHVSGIYGGVPTLVLNQSDFLRKIAHDTYECTVCTKKLKVHPNDRNETEKNFDRHLRTKNHVRNAKEGKAFSINPELQYIFPTLPNYMMENVEYISMNQSHFFCSLCNVNIICNKKDLLETENNFKVHFFQTDHETRLRQRMDLNNEAYSKLNSLFDEVPELVSESLKYISFVDNEYFCNICWQVITEDNDDVDVLGNLLAHCSSSDHESNIKNELDHQSDIVEDLEDLFGSVPKLIEENIMHVEFKGGVNFKCNLCNKTLVSKRNGNYDINTSVTEGNFEKHLDSNIHIGELDSLRRVDCDLQDELDHLFSPIPQYVTNNFQHLGFKNDSDDFECYLCNETIAVVSGNKKSDLTMENFRIHLFSGGHMAQLKHQANIEMVASRELEAIFGKVPSVILSGIDNLELQEDSYHCNLCDACLERTPKSLLTHFYGHGHRALSRKFEDECTEAHHQLDSRFWRLPEFLLIHIDCFVPSENDLFCILCQENLTLDEEDLEETEQELRCHVDSKKHRSFFNTN